MEHHFPLRDVDLALSGFDLPLLIAQPADPEAPLDELAERQRGGRLSSGAAPHIVREGASAAEEARAVIASGTHLPYWALLWPSGMALAEALAAEPAAVANRRALELGCGLGVTAAVALRLGARLAAVDCFAEALLFCRYNTLRATERMPRTLLADWRTASGRAACLIHAPYEIVLAADVLYEREDIAPLLELVPRLLAPGGEFWLAEPGRRVSLDFARAAADRGWRDYPRVYVRDWPPDGKPDRVTVHQYVIHAD